MPAGYDSQLYRKQLTIVINGLTRSSYSHFLKKIVKFLIMPCIPTYQPGLPAFHSFSQEYKIRGDAFLPLIQSESLPCPIKNNTGSCSSSLHCCVVVDMNE